MSEDIAFAKLEPFGDPWRMVALVCATIFNSVRSSKNAKWWRPEDILALDGGEPEEEDYSEFDFDPTETVEEVNALFAAGGITVKHGNDQHASD